MGKKNLYGTARVRDVHIPHGTTTGYWRERNRGLTVCRECKDAWNEHCAQYRLANGIHKTRRSKPRVR